MLRLTLDALGFVEIATDNAQTNPVMTVDRTDITADSTETTADEA